MGRPGQKAEQDELRARMRDLGMTHDEIAVEFARRYRLRPRAAHRLAHGWTQQQAAGHVNAHAARAGIDPTGTAPMTAPRLCELENWPHPDRRRPTPQILALLAEVYGTDIHSLLDLDDREHLTPADTLLISRTERVLRGHVGEPPGGIPEQVRPPSRSTGPHAAVFGLPFIVGESGDTVEIGDGEDSYDEGHSVKRRSFLSTGGVAAVDAAFPAPVRLIQALDIVTSDDADDILGVVTTDCLNELIGYYSERLSVSPPADIYDDLLHVRSYAGTLLSRAGSGARQRSDLLVAAGWLSDLLAVASSYMGDHGSALVWCVDAERRSSESGHPEIAGWAALAKATMVYYQGQAARSIELASLGQGVAPGGTVVHAKLAAQEMRARAMLGDADGMAQAKRRAAKAIAELPSEVPATGVFSIALSEEPPYTATSLLLVGRFREAVSVTKSIIENAYPAGAQNRSRQSSSYARTLLILGLAEAGLGRIGEAAAAGRAALDSTGVVWPTLVLAGKLDQVLMRDDKDAAEVAEYHVQYLDMVRHASGGRSDSAVARRGAR
jgi:hypothetical protein